MYYEDADLCLRSRAAGYSVLYFPEAKIFHHIGKSSFTDRTSFFIHYYESKLLFYAKHYSPLYAFLSTVVIVLGIVVRVPIYALAGAVLLNKKFLRLSGDNAAVLVRLLRTSGPNE